MTVQDSIARKLYDFQNKLQSFNVQLKGTQVSTMIIEMTTDQYGNTESAIQQYFDVDCVFDFPQDEIPVSLSSTQNNMSENSSQVLHLWDLLPISMWVKNNDIKILNFKKGSIVLYPLKMADGNIQVIEFQITDLIAKGNPSSGILYSEYTVAPATDFALRDTEEYKQLVEEFREKCKW